MNDSNSKIPSNESSSFTNEVDLKDLFWVAWSFKWSITLLSSIIAVLAIVYALSLTNYYRSESVLVGVGDQGSSSLSQYSGLASLAGISLPSSGADPVIEMIEIIKSREFVKHLITFKDVLPSMMASKSYNTNSKKITFNPESYDFKSNKWIRKANSNRASKPSYLEAHEKYLGMISISQDIKTGLVSLSVVHISPVFAESFLKLIIQEANNLKRAKDLDMSNKALTYLKKEVTQTSLTEIKESIYKLIESQLQKQMMAKVNEEYSLMTLEPPFVPEEKFKPGRGVIVIILTLLGGLLSTSFVLIRHYFFNNDQKG
jgi:LPS O-antigen subunit length determinant protein (WzzB/FepE family)